MMPDLAKLSAGDGCTLRRGVGCAGMDCDLSVIAGSVGSVGTECVERAKKYLAQNDPPTSQKTAEAIADRIHSAVDYAPKVTFVSCTGTLQKGFGLKLIESESERSARLLATIKTKN